MSDGPLAGLTGVAGEVPAARVAGRLLASLGARVHSAAGRTVTLGNASTTVDADSPGEAWGRTGLGGEPAGAPASVAQACAAVIDLLAANPVGADGPALLAERAALLGLPHAGVVSSGGAARLLPAADGWVAVQLARSEDIHLIPALIEGGVDGDPWGRISDWAAARTTTEITERAALLGLAIGGLGEQSGPPMPWSVRRLAPPVGNANAAGLVVNLGSLWAAPLCAQLLRRAGYRVVDVESSARPDGSRLGTPAFHARLHRGHDLAVIETATPTGRAELAALLLDADVVITSSRRAALHRLGALPPALPDRDQVWVAITGHGLDSERVAFGDDAAVAGDLVAYSVDGTPCFAGDALADPLTGLAAAVAALACARTGESWQVDIALAAVAGFAVHALA